jgi:hypothetical protein
MKIRNKLLELSQSASKRNSSICFAATFFVTAFGLLGGLGRYGFSDDYAVLNSKYYGYPGLAHDWLLIGRPGAVLILKTIWFPIQEIDDLLYIRFVGIFFTAIFSTLIYTFISRKVESNLAAFSISVSSTLLPCGIIFLASWPEAIFAICALILSTISVMILDRGTSRIQIAISFTLSVFAFLTYQPAAIIIVLLPTIRYFMQSLEFKTNSKKLTLNHFPKLLIVTYLVCFGSGFVSLCVLKIANFGSKDSLRTSLVGPLGEKIRFLFEQAIPTQLNFVRPPFGDLPILGFVCLAAILTFVAAITVKSRSITPGIILFLAATSSLIPNFLTGENWPSNRSLMEGQWFYAALTIVSFLFLIRNIPRFGTVAGSLFCVGILFFSVTQSNQTLNRELRTPQITELEAARVAISKLDPNLPIYVKSSSWLDHIAPWVRTDEFGIPSTAFHWVPVPLTELILREQYGSRNFNVILVDEAQSSNFIDFSKILKSLK